jgi:hypothetical protein
MRTPVAAPAPMEADGWFQYAMSLEWLKGYCQQAGDPNAVCCIANIHVDPWDDIPIEVTEPLIQWRPPALATLSGRLPREACEANLALKRFSGHCPFILDNSADP